MLHLNLWRSTSRHLRAFCTHSTLSPHLTLSPVTTHLGPQLYEVRLQHPLLAAGKSPLEVYDAKLCGEASVGSRVILRREMTSEELVRMSDVPEAATTAFGRAYDIISHREADDTYTLCLAQFTMGSSEDSIIHDVPASNLLGGVHTRMLQMPGLQARELADHLRVMWPEPIDSGSVEILMSGAAVREGVVSLSDMLAGEVAFRVHGEPVSCGASKTLAKDEAKASGQVTSDLWDAMKALAGLAIVIFGPVTIYKHRQQQKLQELIAEQASDRWQEMSEQEQAEIQLRIDKIQRYLRGRDEEEIARKKKEFEERIGPRAR